MLKWRYVVQHMFVLCYIVGWATGITEARFYKPDALRVVRPTMSKQ